MLKTASRMLAMLEGAELRQLALLLSVAVSDGLIQAVGIASIMPFIAILADPSIADTSRFFGLLKDLLPDRLQDDLTLVTGLLALGILMISNGLSVLDYWLSLRLFNKQSHRLSTRLLSFYLDKELLDFSKRKTADMSTSVLTEVERVVINTMMAGVGLLADLIVTVAIIGLLVLMNPWVTIAAALLLGIGYLLVHLVVGREVHRLGQEYAEAEASMFGGLTQALALFKEIKMSGRATYFVEGFARPARELMRIANRYEILKFVPAQLIEVLAFALILLVALYFSSMRETADFNAIAVIAFFAFAAYRLVPVLKSMLDGLEEIQYGAGMVSKILDELEQSLSVRAVADESDERLTLRDGIRLERITFQYPEASGPVFQGLTVEIPAGRLTCIVGPSGAGKSTLLDLLLGLIGPTEGLCLIDGVPLDASARRLWQNAVGYVPQQVQLLNGSVAENIALGERHIDRSRVEAVARTAGIARLVCEQLPDGYDSLIGDGGQALSSGERQRIGIARALYRGPGVLLLDEATNELDAATEGEVLSNLAALEGVTLIFATHKASVRERADVVIELQGRFG